MKTNPVVKHTWADSEQQVGAGYVKFLRNTPDSKALTQGKSNHKALSSIRILPNNIIFILLLFIYRAYHQVTRVLSFNEHKIHMKKSDSNPDFHG